MQRKIFAGVVADPTTDAVDQGVHAVLTGRYDSLVSLGDESSIDTAKSIGMLGQMEVASVTTGAKSNPAGRASTHCHIYYGRNRIRSNSFHSHLRFWK